MRNVTITLEEDVARWVRVKAAKRETSVSRLVGKMLREPMRSEDPMKRRGGSSSPSSLEPSDPTTRPFPLARRFMTAPVFVDTNVP